jgi:hypothetical protein
MHLLDPVLLVLALWGHTALWATFVNQMHASRLSKAVVIAVNIVGLGVFFLLPLAYLAVFVLWGFAWLHPAPNALALAGAAYYYTASVLGAIAIARWARRKLEKHRVEIVRRETSARHDMAERLGHCPAGRGLAACLARLPRNESFQLAVTEKELELPALSPDLDGLSIVHLSDLHFADAISKQYFVEVMQMANGLEPDLILITGDLVDRAHCIDWVPDTLGRLRARHGVFAIFGNHDARLKHHLARLRRALTDCGIHYLGGRWTLADIGPNQLLLAGNELPWIKPAADMQTFPSRASYPRALRVLLSHSPDQYPWARRHGFDLMLAGHNHGGQVQLPVIGPIFSPSRYGVRYAAGTFHEPPTVMHVSRGISALDPIRYNCLPELARLILRAPVELAIEHEAASGIAVLTGKL